MKAIVSGGPVTAEDALEAANGLKAAHEALEAARRDGKVSARKYAELKDYVQGAARTTAQALHEVEAGAPVPWAMLACPTTIRGMVSTALGVTLHVERRTAGAHDEAARERTLKMARIRMEHDAGDDRTAAGRERKLAAMRRAVRGR